MMFIKTDKQRQAIDLLASAAKHILLYGGSRSGKTFILVYALIVRAAKTKSRHIILRDKFNHIKTTIWLDTLPKVLNLVFPSMKVDFIKTDYYCKLSNGSEIWCAGLDDSARVEKILGRECSTLYFNECSQIDYNSVQIALTRLAEKNTLLKKAYYDCNPPQKSHWSYWQFIKHLNPIDNVPLEDVQNYVHMQMNPEDNKENIDSSYISILNQLPEKQKKRFLLGEFTDVDDGQVYYSFNREKHVGQTQKINGTLFIGMDFNVNPFTAVICQVIDNKLIVHDEVWLENSDTYKMCHYLKIKNYIGNIIPDSTGKNRKTSGRTDFQILEEAGFKIIPTVNPYVVDRVNNLNRLFSEDKIIINAQCKKLINDLEKVSWKNGELHEGKDKMYTHISDALGYAAWNLFKMSVSFKDKSIKLF